MAIHWATLGAAATLLAALLFVLVGRTTLARRTSSEARPAMLGFAIWWFAAAATMLASAAQTWLATAGIQNPTMHSAILHALTIPSTLALAGLLHYLLYLVTGSTLTRAATLAYAGTHFAFSNYIFIRVGPWGFADSHAGIRFVPMGEPSPLLWFVHGLIIATPVLLALASYSFALWYGRDATMRYRSGLILASLAVWFGALLVTFTLGWNEQPRFLMATQLPGVAAAAIALAAYHPPAWVQRRYGIASARDDTAPTE